MILEPLPLLLRLLPRRQNPLRKRARKEGPVRALVDVNTRTSHKKHQEGPRLDCSKTCQVCLQRLICLQSVSLYQKSQSYPVALLIFVLDVHVASFFSIHRPISVTAPYPSISSETSFSSIFSTAKQQKPHPADVIYTIASAVEGLETASFSNNPQTQQQQEESDFRTAITQASSSNAETTHLDAHPQTQIRINIQELAKNFRPFFPPPPPVALGSPEEAAQRIERNRATKQKSYSTVLRILETTHPDGQITYKTRTSPIREDPIAPAANISIEAPSEAPLQRRPEIRQPFLNRMRIRQEVWEDSPKAPRGRKEQWRAISVKRQRKLKMKKHKYKKLMRRTRNVRRRLDRN